MAKPQRNSKGHFVKSSNAPRKRRKASSSTSTALVRRSSSTPTHRRASSSAPRRRRKGATVGGVKLLHLGLAAAGIAYVTGANGPKFIVDNVNKIPGAKTFGPTAALGIGCLAVDKFVKPNKWLKLAGYTGLVLAAVKVGTAGTSFKWVGDDESTGDYDLGDGDDVGDEDDVGDYDE